MTEENHLSTVSDLFSDTVAHFIEALSEGVLQYESKEKDLWIRVKNSSWAKAAQVAKSINFNYFCFLSGIDWKDNDELGSEKLWQAPSESVESKSSKPPPKLVKIAGGQSRFQVFARLFSIEKKLGLFLKTDLDEKDLVIDSWSHIYKGANWHERETWEMFGFVFKGHSDLRHIYLPSSFEGNPLRKDFSLLARQVKPWPGLVDPEDMPEQPEQSNSKQSNIDESSNNSDNSEQS